MRVSPTLQGGWCTARPRAPCRGLARCSGHDCNNGAAAAGWQQQPSHHTRKGLAVGKPRLRNAQVLVHDSRHLASSDAGVFCLALSISDLSPSPSLLGAHGFHIGNKGGVGPGLRQHMSTNSGGNGNGVRAGRGQFFGGFASSAVKKRLRKSTNVFISGKATKILQNALTIEYGTISTYEPNLVHVLYGQKK